MEPRIIQEDEIVLVGLDFFGDPFEVSAEWTEENEIGRLWNRFMDFYSKNRQSIQHVADTAGMYEVHVTHDETHQKGNLEVFVGMRVSKLEQTPVELLVKVLPPATYAVFTLRGKEIVGDWPWELNDLLPRAGYQRAAPYAYLRYDERFKGMDQLEGAELDVFVPVTRLP